MLSAVHDSGFRNSWIILSATLGESPHRDDALELLIKRIDFRASLSQRRRRRRVGPVTQSSTQIAPDNLTAHGFTSSGSRAKIASRSRRTLSIASSTASGTSGSQVPG